MVAEGVRPSPHLNPPVSLIKTEDLIPTLRVTTKQVKVFRLSETTPSLMVTPVIAIAMVRGGHFEGGGSKHRVRYIRETKPSLKWVEGWRTTDSAVLAFEGRKAA